MNINPLGINTHYFKHLEKSVLQVNNIASNKINANNFSPQDNPATGSFRQVSHFNFNFSLNDSLSDMVISNLSVKSKLLSSANQDRKIILEQSVNKSYENMVNEVTSGVAAEFSTFFNGANNYVSENDDFHDVIGTEQTTFNKDDFQGYLKEIFDTAMNLAEKNDILGTSSDIEESKNKLGDLLIKQFDSQGDSFEKMSYKDIVGLYTGIKLYNSDALNNNNLAFPVKTGIIKAVTEKYISNSDISSSLKDTFLNNVNNLLNCRNTNYTMNRVSNNLNSEFEKLNKKLSNLLDIYNKLENDPIRKGDIIMIYNPLLQYSPFAKTKFHFEKDNINETRIDDYKKNLFEQINSLKDRINENQYKSNELKEHPQDFRKTADFKDEYGKEQELFNKTYNFLKNSDNLSDSEKSSELSMLDTNNLEYKKGDALKAAIADKQPINSLSDFMPIWNEFSKNMVNGEKMLINIDSYYIDIFA